MAGVSLCVSKRHSPEWTPADYSHGLSQGSDNFMCTHLCSIVSLVGVSLHSSCNLKVVQVRKKFKYNDMSTYQED